MPLFKPRRPTLSREGIVAQTTQVDAGFYGTLNWTFTNTSATSVSFVLRSEFIALLSFVLRVRKGRNIFIAATIKNRYGMSAGHEGPVPESE